MILLKNKLTRRSQIVVRNPVLFMLILLLAGGTYIAYYLSLLGPILQMSTAAYRQAVEIAKQKLREFVENSDTARAAIAMPSRQDSSISMDTLDSRGKKKTGNSTTASFDDDI